MKNKMLLLGAVILVLTLTGCKGTAPKNAEEDIKKPVRAIEVKETASTKELHYIGTVKPETVKKLSFKASGKIAAIKAEQGQKVKKGETIALLDTKDLSFAVEAARAAKAGAEAQYSKALNGATAEDIDLASANVVKAQKAYEFARDSLEKARKVYEGGGMSKQDLDKAELELSIREQEYIGAKTMLQQAEKGAREEDKQALKSQLDQADTDLRYKQSALADADLKADMDGYVMEVLSEQGELIAAGYPVVILGSADSIVSFGLTQEDAAEVKLGDRITIESKGALYDGKIKNISKIMDMETQTYNAEAVLENADLPAGSVVKVSVPAGEYNAVMIPLNSVLRGDYDYVYLSDNGIAQKKEIKIGKVQGDMVEVTGLNKGEMLILEGIKSISHGDKIEIIR